MNITRKWAKKALIGGALASLLAVGSVAAGATAAQAYPKCSTSTSGRTGTATCVANGTPFLFQVSVRCAFTNIWGTTTKYVSGPQRSGGGSSSATCPSDAYQTYTPNWVGVVVAGG